MRKSVAAMLGVLLALLVAMPFCVEIRTDLVGRADAPAPPTTGVQPEKKRDTTRPPKRLRWRQFDVAAAPVPTEIDRVAFLPMLNRGGRRIHSTGLDAVSTTLAADAALHTKGRIVAPEPVVTSRVNWFMGDAVEPKWKARHGYSIDVDGDPSMTLSFGIRPGSASNIRDIRREMDLGMIATACPAVNAVPAVCRAAPGILGYADLPIHAARFSG